MSTATYTDILFSGPQGRFLPMWAGGTLWVLSSFYPCGGRYLVGFVLFLPIYVGGRYFVGFVLLTCVFRPEVKSKTGNDVVNLSGSLETKQNSKNRFTYLCPHVYM